MHEIHIKPEIRSVSTKNRQCQTLRFYEWNGAGGDLPTKTSVHCTAHGFYLEVKKDLGCLSTCWSCIILFYSSVFCKVKDLYLCFGSVATLQGVLLALKDGSKLFWLFCKTFLHRSILTQCLKMAIRWRYPPGEIYVYDICVWVTLYK